MGTLGIVLLKRPGTTEARSSWTFSDHPEYGEGLGKRDGVSLVPLKVVLVRNKQSRQLSLQRVQGAGFVGEV